MFLNDQQLWEQVIARRKLKKAINHNKFIDIKLLEIFTDKGKQYHFSGQTLDGDRLDLIGTSWDDLIPKIPDHLRKDN